MWVCKVWCSGVLYCTYVVVLYMVYAPLAVDGRDDAVYIW